MPTGKIWKELIMNAFLELIGLTSAEFTRIVTLGIVLLVILIVGRVALKLTATLFKIGCFTILLVIGAIYIISVMMP
jgi:hypothetical protein